MMQVQKTATLGTAKPLPAWIWHPAKQAVKIWTATTTWYAAEESNSSTLWIALTGSAKIKLNGKLIAEIDEDPKYIAEFACVLIPFHTAGKHHLKIEISCTETMPIIPINVHLTERSTGLLAYLTGDGVWQASGEDWLADDKLAGLICKYGEEPYGDLDNAPPWFIAGGYGDISVEPIDDVRLVDHSYQDAEYKTYSLFLQGQLQTAWTLPNLTYNRVIFYHIRKQGQWRELRTYQRQQDLTKIPWARLDLNKAYNARFRVQNRGGIPVTILWNGAESVFEMKHYEGCITEAFKLSPGEEIAIQPQGMRYLDFYVLGEPQANSYLLEINFEAVQVALEQVGLMNSDLEQANRIFEVSTHTNAICHQHGLWDGIKRDRLNWAYDVYLAAKADYVLWNDFGVLKRAIIELGKTPYGFWMNSIAAYTFWWICNLWEYYYCTEDRDFIMGAKDDLHRHLRWIEDNLDDSTGFMKERNKHFLEWVPMTEEESWFAFHALVEKTRRHLIELQNEIPELELGINWVRPVIKEKDFLDAEMLITPLLGIQAGYLSHDAAMDFLKSYTPKDPITPLSSFWFIETCSQYGLHDQAWEALNMVWGKMLESDATTFWESVALHPKSNFHDAQTTYTAYDSYRMSLCHSWSSTPVQWFSRVVLGVEPQDPGYRRIRFSPQSVGGMRKCEGTVNTPHGPIYVSWSMLNNGELSKNIKLPEGVEVVI